MKQSSSEKREAGVSYINVDSSHSKLSVNKLALGQLLYLKWGAWDFEGAFIGDSELPFSKKKA